MSFSFLLQLVSHLFNQSSIDAYVVTPLMDSNVTCNRNIVRQGDRYIALLKD